MSNPQFNTQSQKGVPMSNTQSSSSNKVKDKKTWVQRVAAFMAKVFDIIKGLISIVWEFFRNLLALIGFTFDLIIKLVSQPTTMCTVAIVFFGFVFTIAMYQWFQIGAWIGSVLGFNSLLGIGMGVLGLGFGFGINIYQMAPTLYKISKDVAAAYVKIGLDKPEEHKDNPESISQKLVDWYFYDHKTMKSSRLVSYLVESALSIGFVFATGASLGAIAIAAISLGLPEQMLKAVHATSSLAAGLNRELLKRDANGDLIDKEPNQRQATF